MENEETIKERERIRKIVERKIDELISYREETIKRVHRRNIPLLEKLKDDIFFLIDNPNYVRKTKPEI